MEKQVIIGRGNPSGQNVAIGADARARSTYVIGITGTGKSTLLESIAYQDMANRDGLCFLDPHGDSVKKLLASVPDYRESDVIFWDPGDIDRPFGFNPFFCSDPANELEVSRKAQSFIDALGSLREFVHIFESAPRMKNMLQQLATTFIVNQGHTLAETPKFLLDQEYRQQFYPALSNRFDRVRRYWEEELDARSEREQREITESSLNKLERFQSDPVLYSIFGQPTNSIDFRNTMDTGAIILINLGADRGGLIGAFVVWELLQTAFSRTDIPEHERRPFHLFADEFQTYMTTAFPMLQAQARKYGIDTVIAHQVRAQLTPEIAEITPAVGNLIIFRVTSHNAGSLSWEFDTTPPAAEPVVQMVTEPVYETYIEEGWTSKEAEEEFKTLGVQRTRLRYMIDLMQRCFWDFNFTQKYKYSWAFFAAVKSDDPKTQEDLVRSIYRMLNPNHKIKAVRDYASNLIFDKHPISGSLQFHSHTERQLHPFPIEFPCEAEYALGRSATLERVQKDAKLKEMVEVFTSEFLSLFLPVKEKAVYCYSLAIGRSRDGEDGHIGNGSWELTPFPAVLAWVKEKSINLSEQIEAVEKKQCELQRLYYKKEEKKRYKGYDVPAKVFSGGPNDSGQQTYHTVPGIPRPRSDVAAGIANQLVGLANFQARCKITRENARPTEHLIHTFDYPGVENEELAQRLQKKSSKEHGRDRSEVERAIEERLKIKREIGEIEGEPILRERSNGKRHTPSKRKRPRTVPDRDRP